MNNGRSSFTYASLFSGIGGFEQALNKLGGICVFASENDKFAARAYEVLYGFEPAGDITKIDAKDIPDHDLLTAGFPCQAFSVAGKRKGFEDTRGTLFFEIARIAKEKRPKALLLENVKGLVNHDKGRTLDIMISVLNEIGYVIDFEVLNSKYFGVPQNRERIFIVAIREDLIEAEPFNEDSLKGNTIVRKRKRQINEWAKTFNFNWPEQTEVTTRLRDILETDVDEKYYLDEEKTAKLVAQLDKGLPAHFPTPNDINNTLRTGGKGSLTAKHNYEYIAEPQMIGHVDIKGHDAIKRVYSTEGISPTLTTMGGGHREPKIAEEQEWWGEYESEQDEWKTERRIRREEVRQIAEAQEIANGDNISYCIDANYSKGISPKSVGKGRRTHVIEEVRPVLTLNRLEKRQNGRRFKEDGEEMFTLTAQDCQGLPIREATKKGYTIAEEGDSVNIQFPNSKTRRGRVGKQIANTLEASSINQGVVEVVEKEEVRPVLTPDRIKKRQNGRRFKENDEEMFTLTSQDRHGVVIRKKRKYRIRKLTPRECWRLQGFPDEAHDAVMSAGISDSQRYKQAGNAVTVNVVEAIGERLIRYL